MQELAIKVSRWAEQNAPGEYMGGSRSGMFGAALKAGVITSEEYEAAKSYYGRLWNYTGD